MSFFVRAMGAAALVVAAAACGGGDGGTITGTGGGGGGGSNNLTCSGATFCLGAAEFTPTSATVLKNTEVVWQNNSGVTHNVTFDNPGAALSFNGGPSGNIPNFSSGSASRTFAVAGTYTFHCTIHAGMNGSVTVQ